MTNIDVHHKLTHIKEKKFFDFATKKENVSIDSCWSDLGVNFHYEIIFKYKKNNNGISKSHHLPFIEFVCEYKIIAEIPRIVNLLTETLTAI